MIVRRQTLVAIGAAALVTPFRMFAQSKSANWRIGFLGATSATAFGFAERLEALRTGLRDLGYEEGRNLTIHFRWADDRYERLPQLAVELIRLNVDLIVTHSQGTRAAKNASSSIPIVMALSARPGCRRRGCKPCTTGRQRYGNVELQPRGSCEAA